MGGTSTDVSRYAGSYEHVFESTTAGVTIQAPQLDINTVAAGGGSRLFYRCAWFRVGTDGFASNEPCCSVVRDLNPTQNTHAQSGVYAQCANSRWLLAVRQLSG